MIVHFLKQEFTRSPLTKLAAWIAMPVLKAFRNRVDPRRYNGASLVGLNGIVIKSHGGADALAFEYSINEALLEVSKNVPGRISTQLEHLLSQRRAG